MQLLRRQCGSAQPLRELKTQGTRYEPSNDVGIPPSRTLAGRDVRRCRAGQNYLTEIEDHLVSDVPLAAISRKCLVMSGCVHFPEAEGVAEQELNGTLGKSTKSSLRPSTEPGGVATCLCVRWKRTGHRPSIADWKLP